jgi:transposase-like protein
VPRPASVPDCSAVSEALQKFGSVTALAKHFGISFTTARKWIQKCGLADSLDEPSHIARLKQIIEDSSKRGRRKKVDADLGVKLADIRDRKLLARAIVDEFNIRYVHKKCFSWERYVLKLALVMYDFPPVEQIARLVGIPWRMTFRKAKSGAEVPIWLVTVEGYRAFRILQLMQPFLTGQKAFQANIALQAGPITLHRIHLGKEIYERDLLASFGVKAEMFRGKGADT